MGANKLLLDVEGQPMVRRAAVLLQAAGLAPLIAVLGHEAPRVQEALAGLPVACVVNERYHGGMATSLTLGLAALPAAVDAVLIHLADMPLVTQADIAALCAAFAPASGRAVCIPVHEGRRGNPVLLGRQMFAALAGLTGDEGAKSIIRQHSHLVVEVPAGPEVLFDIDTPDAYAPFRRKGNQTGPGAGPA